MPVSYEYHKNMSNFIVNMRQGMSNWFDSLTGQENTYHQSTGKTQEEFEQDLDFYENLEDILRAETVTLGTIGGAMLPMSIPFAGAAPGGYLPWLFTEVQKRLDEKENGYVRR